MLSKSKSKYNIVRSSSLHLEPRDRPWIVKRATVGSGNIASLAAEWDLDGSYRRLCVSPIAWSTAIVINTNTNPNSNSNNYKSARSNCKAKKMASDPSVASWSTSFSSHKSGPLMEAAREAGGGGGYTSPFSASTGGLAQAKANRLVANANATARDRGRRDNEHYLTASGTRMCTSIDKKCHSLPNAARHRIILPQQLFDSLPESSIDADYTDYANYGENVAGEVGGVVLLSRVDVNASETDGPSAGSLTQRRAFASTSSFASSSSSFGSRSPERANSSFGLVASDRESATFKLSSFLSAAPSFNQT